VALNNQVSKTQNDMKATTRPSSPTFFRLLPTSHPSTPFSDGQAQESRVSLSIIQKDMNTDDFKKEVKSRYDDRGGRVLAGIILVGVGVLFLLRQADFDLPWWLFSWKTIVIAVGLFIGAKRSFRPGIWMLFTGVGLTFLLNDIFFGYNLRHSFWPIMLIGFGLFMILRPRGGRGSRWDSPTEFSDDTIDSVAIFGGAKKHIISKKFKGGDLTTVFGGTELNFGQADVEGSATLEITQVFGGTKLVVPANWHVKSEVVCIFGGIDDKRREEKITESNKVLVLKGTCIFGGIDIKSY
jgi:predicted membrane protein